ncbi:DUF58 domain-containing protein [Rathayibacter soli]|uniref:DUF58 domain-containing protein n=1 Tax=Rathayibacter soli TaxID=3144168 RepID=UPI0027E5A74F|nr:DUF58 domain-containing protein [Glaciibacter superstes]
MSGARERMPRVTRPRPTLRGWALETAGILAFIGAVWLGRVDLLFVGLVLTVLPPAAMLALVLDRPWLSVSRSFSPEIVATGEEAQATLTVRNHGSRSPSPMRWRDMVGTGLSAPGPAPLPWLAEHGLPTRNRPDTATLHYRIRTQHRGVYEVGPVLLARLDPFGLARAEYAVGGERPLLVTPRVVPLAHGELDTATTEGTEYELLRHSIPSADELIAREYRTGDPLRRVHWRATARHDKLMVRQEEQRSDPNAWILFDTRRAARTDRHVTRHHSRNAAFEQAVTLVAALGSHLLNEGFVVNVVETGRVQFSGRTGAGRLGVLGSAAASFELPAGEQLLLANLASVRQVGQSARQRERDASSAGDILADGLRRGGKAVPVFAVLVDGGLSDVTVLASVRHQCDPAVAFLLGGASRLGDDDLVRAGFTCVTVSSGDDPQTAWREASRLYSEATRHG